MNNRGIAPMMVLLIFLAIATIGVLVATGNINIASVVGGPINYNAVYKADYGRIQCIAGPIQTLDGPRYADNVKSTTCSENVDQSGCTITLSNSGLGIFPLSLTASYKFCNADGSSCSSYTSQSLQKNGPPTSFNLPPGKMVVFANPGSTPASDSQYFQWARTGAVYSLVEIQSGRSDVINQGSCFIDQNSQRQTFAETPNPIPKGLTTSQNFLIDFVQTATQTYPYNGQQVVCQARQLYSIVPQKMLDGNTIQIQGNPIKIVDCCPSEPNCNNNFQLVTNNVRQCNFNTECSNAGNNIPVDQVTAKYFTCDSGTCVPHTISVECTSDAVCQQRHGQGYVCDLSVANYGICKQSVGTFCGDGFCDVGESKSTCPADCEIQCQSGEKLVKISQPINCLVGWPLNIGCQTQISQECQGQGVNWYKIIIVILAVILILFLLVKFRGAAGGAAKGGLRGGLGIFEFLFALGPVGWVIGLVLLIIVLAILWAIKGAIFG